MTSDGISTSDWERVQELAAQMVNATMKDNSSDCQRIEQQMLKSLDLLEGKYGALPSITATRADYVNDMANRAALLERAYQQAEAIGDKKNLTFISSSLAELYIEDLPCKAKAIRWLSALEDSLGYHWDDMEYGEFKRLRGKLLQGEQ